MPVNPNRCVHQDILDRPDGASALHRARQAMRAGGFWNRAQQMGRRWPIACVALEITQRCNLDCTLCYLSEHSEAVRDLPLEVIFRRIDAIADHYGSGIDVQITGGDPTLRDHAELLTIVARLRAQGQRPTLMTNGIRADRRLLQRLAGAGLVDVAFHVDTTQQRKGFAGEADLNRLRLRYINNARGLGLSIMFNTTVHGGNFHELPALVTFFRHHADAIRTASFQLQADTGRGIHSGRDSIINNASVWAQIERGLGVSLNRNASQVGHPQCSGYGMSLVCNDRAVDLFHDTATLGELQALTARIPLPRSAAAATLKALLRWTLRQPLPAGRALIAGLRLLRPHWRALLNSRGKIHSLSFVTHNFMHAHALDPERLNACVFTTMTAQGPVSMCRHNARRDDYILAPVTLDNGRTWQPLNACEDKRVVDISALDPSRHGIKHSKGRTRQALLHQRHERSGVPA